RQVPDKGKLCLKFFDHLVVGGDNFGVFSLGQGDVQNVIDGDSVFQGYLVGSWNEGNGRMKNGKNAKEVENCFFALSRLEPSLKLCHEKCIGGFRDEEIWSK